MLFLFAIVAQLSTAHAGTSSEAIQLLSRFPAGAVPEIPEVLDAVDQLGQKAQTGELALLESLVKHESGAVRSSATDAIARIRARLGLAPSPDAVLPLDAYVAELVVTEVKE